MVWELTKDIAETGFSIWDKASALRTAWINRNGFLHAYYFETRLNLDLLAAVKRDALAAVSAGSPAFAALVGSLETTGGLALLAGHDRRAYRRFVKLLKKHWTARRSYNDDEPDSTAETPAGVLDAVSFSVRKIEALKRIVRISEKEGASFFPAFNLKKRLDNINVCLLDITNCLAVVIPLAER